MEMPSLSWRVPTSGDPRHLRLGLTHIVLATIVAALAIVVAAPRPWVAPALLGLVPLAVFLAYRRWHRFQQSQIGPDNVRIDSSGVHWFDASGQARAFTRENVTAFRIGREPDTLRPVPALTLHLQGGFESQPIELHPPATPDAVRSLLAGAWGLSERQTADSGNCEAARAYDVAVNIYSECHEEFQEWHWEGSHPELSRLFALFAACAGDALPPEGAKPAPRIIAAQRRTPARLALAHFPTAHFDRDTIAAPAGLLREIARRAKSALDNLADTGDAKFDVSLGPKNAWTFHLHVPEEHQPEA